MSDFEKEPMVPPSVEVVAMELNQSLARPPGESEIDEASQSLALFMGREPFTAEELSELRKGYHAQREYERNLRRGEQ